MEIGNKLKILRKSQDRTINDICQKTSLSKEYLYKLENDLIDDISLNKIKELADFYNVDICYLIKEDSISKEKIPADFKKFITKENIDYLQISIFVRKSGLSVSEAKKILNDFSDTSSEEYKYYQLAMKAKEKGISIKQLNKTIDILNIKKRVGVFPCAF